MNLHRATWSLAALGMVLMSATSAIPHGRQRTAAVSKQVFVVNTGEDTVSLVDLSAMKEMGKYKVGPRPYGIAVSQDGKTVAVGVEDEECVSFSRCPISNSTAKPPSARCSMITSS